MAAFDIFVHEALICARSEFFRAALKKDWPEGQTRIVQLPDDDYDNIKSYVQCLYSGDVSQVIDKSDGRVAAFERLAELYTLGEKLIDDQFQDLVISHFILATRDDYHDENPCSEFPNDAAINTIYQGTTTGSPARRVLVDMCLYHGSSTWVSKGKDGVWGVCHEYKDDVVIALLTRMKSLDADVEHFADRAELCGYHKHGEDEPCAASSKK